MARWLPVLALEVGAGTTTWLASAGGFLLAVTCVLAVAAVVTASCAAHFNRRDNKNQGSTGFKPARKLASLTIINSSKKLLLSKKWGRKEDDEETYDRDAINAEGGGASEEWRGNEDEEDTCDRDAMKAEGGGDYVWQRSILMGERCQPPDFSGLIIYDDKGNRLPQFPLRSPKLTVLHSSLDQQR